MPNNNTEVFYSDGREGKNPQNFLRAFRREMHALVTTDNKVIAKAFVNYLGAGSTADKWYEDLPQLTQESWMDIETEFAQRWPCIKQATRSEQELEQELLITVLEEKELGEKVNNGGIEVWSHVAWADKIAILVNEANLSMKTTYIWQVRDKLPEAIKDVVKSSQADWTAFLQAVRDIDLQHIHDAIEKSKKREREQNTVESRLCLLEVAQSLPTAGICTQLSRTSIAVPQSPLPAPHFTTMSCTPGNTFTNQTGGQGNLTFVPRPNSQTRTPMSTSQVDAICARLNTLPHHPDNDTGRATYRKQLANWDTKHGSQTRVTEEIPYPLRPGTSPICTAECWNCSTNGHRRDACPIPIGNEARIGPKEAAWRCICMMTLGPINRTNNAPIHLVVVNEYPPRTPWAEELGSEGVVDQGNGEGSSA